MDEQTFKIFNKAFMLATVLVAVIAVYLLGSMFYQFAGLPGNAPKEISITGEGKAYIKPDIATTTLGVKTEGASVADVTNRNNTKMNAITKAIKDAGVDEKDIQTSLYNLYPNYNYTEVRGRIFEGYILEQQVTVKIRNFDKINDILDKATQSGANTVGQLQFTVEDMETVRVEARQKAIDQAKAKAQVLAKQAGLSLSKIVNISEGYNSYPQPLYGMGGANSAKEMSSVAPDIQAGQMEVNTTVYLTYKVK